MADNASVPEVESWREVHSNAPMDGRHFGTFLVHLPVGVAPHRDLADDMARDAVEEVYADLLSSADDGYNLTVHPAQRSSKPKTVPIKSSNGCEVSFTWSDEGIISMRF
jgi:hypothetical protein